MTFNEEWLQKYSKNVKWWASMGTIILGLSGYRMWAVLIFLRDNLFLPSLLFPWVFVALSPCYTGFWIKFGLSSHFLLRPISFMNLLVKLVTRTWTCYLPGDYVGVVEKTADWDNNVFFLLLLLLWPSLLTFFSTSG